VPANNITVFPTSGSSDFSTGSRSYSLCAVWIHQWKGHSYVFSRWISRYIWPIPWDRFYSRSHFTIDHTFAATSYPHPPAVQLHSNRHFSILVGAPQPRLTLFYFIPQLIPPLSALLYSIPHSIPPFPRSSAQDGSSSHPTGAHIMHSTLLTHHLSVLLRWDKHCSIPSVLLCLDWLSCISFSTHLPPPPLSVLLNFIPHSLTPPLSALLSLDSMLFFFIPRFSNTFHVTPLFHTTLPILVLLVSPGSCSHYSSECIILPLVLPFRFAASQHLTTRLVDITNRPRRHWNVTGIFRPKNPYNIY